MVFLFALKNKKEKKIVETRMDAPIVRQFWKWAGGGGVNGDRGKWSGRRKTRGEGEESGTEGIKKGGDERSLIVFFSFFACRMSSIHSLRLSYRSWSLSRTRGSTYRRRRGDTTRSTRSGWASRRSASARRNSRWVWPPIWLRQSVAEGKLEGSP